MTSAVSIAFIFGLKQNYELKRKLRDQKKIIEETLRNVEEYEKKLKEKETAKTAGNAKIVDIANTVETPNTADTVRYLESAPPPPPPPPPFMSSKIIKISNDVLND